MVLELERAVKPRADLKLDNVVYEWKERKSSPRHSISEIDVVDFLHPFMQYCIEDLYLSDFKIKVTLKNHYLGKPNLSWVGFAKYKGRHNKKPYEMHLSTILSKRELLSTAAHELRHIWQLQSGAWSEDSEGRALWKGRPFDSYKTKHIEESDCRRYEEKLRYFIDGYMMEKRK